MTLYVCRKCGAVFSSEEDLENHVELEMSDSSDSLVEYVCEECEAIFGSEEALYEHIESEHAT